MYLAVDVPSTDVGTSYPAGNAFWVNLGSRLYLFLHDEHRLINFVLLTVDTFMNHTAIVANLSQVTSSINFLDSSPKTENIVFNLGETNMDFVNLDMNQFGACILMRIVAS